MDVSKPGIQGPGTTASRPGADGEGRSQLRVGAPQGLGRTWFNIRVWGCPTGDAAVAPRALL